MPSRKQNPKNHEEIDFDQNFGENNFWGPIFKFRAHWSTKITENQGVTSTPLSLRHPEPKPWTYIY